MRLALLLVIASLLGTACGPPKSQRCEQVCRREADCADELGDSRGEELRFDQGECVDQCTQLERSTEGAAKVTAHIRCVEGAPSCSAVLECR